MIMMTMTTMMTMPTTNALHILSPEVQLIGQQNFKLTFTKFQTSKINSSVTRSIMSSKIMKTLGRSKRTRDCQIKRQDVHFFMQIKEEAKEQWSRPTCHSPQLKTNHIIKLGKLGLTLTGGNCLAWLQISTYLLA